MAATFLLWPYLTIGVSAAGGAVADFFKWLDVSAAFSPIFGAILVNILSAVILGTLAFVFRDQLGRVITSLWGDSSSQRAEAALRVTGASPAELSPALASIGTPPQTLVVRVEGPGALVPAVPSKPSNLPGSIGHLFKGRDAFLKRLHESFARHDAAAITAKAVHGLGGLGKTRAAIEYAHAHADDYGATFFLSGKSGSGLRDGLAELAGAAVLNLPERDLPDLDARADAAIGWLRAHPGWLMIIDNVDDPDAAEAAGALLGRVGGAGHVLITSRIGDWGHRVEAIDLDLLSVAAAKELLRASTPRRAETTDEEAALTRLADAQLGCLSLALVQAAAFIDEKHVGFADYSERFEKESEALLAKLGPAAKRNLGYQFPVAATWQTSFSQLSEAGRRLLDMLAWLSIEPIPRTLFAAWPDADIDLEEALEELARYSLVHWEEGFHAITLHRLVAQVTRDNLDLAGRDRALGVLFEWLEAFNAELTASDVRDWPKFLPLLPHMLQLFARISDYGPYSGQASAYDKFAILLYSLARYAEAEPLFRKALSIDEATLGRDHPAVATRLNNLAELLRATGRPAEAEPLLRRALAIGEASLGPDHPTVAIRLSNLAGLLKTTGRLAEAEPLIRRALAIDEASRGADHPDVAIDLNNLAALLEDTGRRSEAEPLYRRALSIGEASLGPDHPNVAIRLSNLAGLLKTTGRPAEAEPLIRRALAIDEASVGSDHPKVATRLNNLATLLEDTGRQAEVEPLYCRAALILLRSSKASGHLLPNTASALGNYLGAMLRAGKAKGEARALVELAMREAGFDPNVLWPRIFGE